MRYLNLRYIFIFIVCIWAPLQTYILKIDGAQRSILFLAVLICLVYLQNKSFRKNIIDPPFIFWLLWVIYAFFNTINLGSNIGLPTLSLFTLLFVPLVIVWFINIDQYQDREYIFNVIILGLFIRVLLSYAFESGNMQAFDDRLGEKINANEIAVSAVVLICFVFLKYFHLELKLYQLILLISFPTYVIILTGSRGSFGALILIIFSFFIINRTHKVKRDLALFLIGSLIVFFAISLVLDNTSLGLRLSNTLDQGENLNNFKSNSPLLQKFGDRGIFYQLGFEIFLDHPIRGIGLGNFSKYSGAAVQHSEYMIQLCELGLIGSTFFLLFYGYIGRNLVIVRRKYIDDRKVIEAYIAVFSVILFMAISLFQYNLVVFFFLSGCLIGFVRDVKGREDTNYEE